jgi:hypothetical protein
LYHGTTGRRKQCAEAWRKYAADEWPVNLKSGAEDVRKNWKQGADAWKKYGADARKNWKFGANVWKK